jgi:hypothetical protein
MSQQEERVWRAISSALIIAAVAAAVLTVLA